MSKAEFEKDTEVVVEKVLHYDVPHAQFDIEVLFADDSAIRKLLDRALSEESSETAAAR